MTFREQATNRRELNSPGKALRLMNCNCQSEGSSSRAPSIHLLLRFWGSSNAPALPSWWTHLVFQVGGQSGCRPQPGLREGQGAISAGCTSLP